jgi:hypothetical protein
MVKANWMRASSRGSSSGIQMGSSAASAIAWRLAHFA